MSFPFYAISLDDFETKPKKIIAGERKYKIRTKKSSNLREICTAKLECQQTLTNFFDRENPFLSGQVLLHLEADPCGCWRLETEAVRLRLLEAVEAEDNSWSPIRGSAEEDGAKMSSNSLLSLVFVTFSSDLGSFPEATVAASKSVGWPSLSASPSSPPHKRFISSNTRKKSSSLVEVTAISLKKH